MGSQVEALRVCHGYLVLVSQVEVLHLQVLVSLAVGPHVQPIREVFLLVECLLVLVLVLQAEGQLVALEDLLLFPALQGDGSPIEKKLARPAPCAQVHLLDEKGHDFGTLDRRCCCQARLLGTH